MKGRVVILKAYHAPLEIDEFDLPEMEPGAVLVRTTMAGICGSDLHTWRGDQAARALPPSGRCFGHEGTGVVAALGAGVSTDFLGNTLKEGDRVVYSATVSCRRCRYCLNGDTNLCERHELVYRRADAGQFPYFIGTFGDYIYLAPGHPVFRTPDELTDAEVAPANCAYGTVLQGLRRADLRVGQHVVVQGCGGLGLAAIGMAHELGAATVTAIDGQAPRLALAREFGATDTIDISEHAAAEDRVVRVREFTGGHGADLVVELVGLGALMTEGLSMLAAGGTFLEIGNIIGGSTAVVQPNLLLRGRRIIGSAMYRQALLPEVIDLLVRTHKNLPFHRIVSHQFPLADVNQAFSTAEWSGKDTPVIRGVLVP
jgi:D-arabinose 1-dehydrogenase-like Zn-dependent alcohol dehydrogenase